MKVFNYIFGSALIAAPLSLIFAYLWWNYGLAVPLFMIGSALCIHAGIKIIIAETKNTD